MCELHDSFFDVRFVMGLYFFLIDACALSLFNPHARKKKQLETV